MSSAGKKRKGMLLLGLLLLAVGIALAFASSGGTGHGFKWLWSVFLIWMMRLWPVLLICMGVVRVMGYAVERKPRSPLGGMLLIIIGVLFLASRLHANLNALQIYGRYWLLLLAVFAGVELVRYYSHRHTEGPPPRLFTPGRVLIIAFIVITGVLANRIAGAHPSLLSALKLPRFLSGIRDSVVGENYSFADSPAVVQAVMPGAKVTVTNSYGNVKVTGGASAVRATLTKGVRAWREEDARRIADEIRLIVKETPDGLSITTNRDEINQQFTTDIQVEVPSSIILSVADSYGSISASGIQGRVDIKASYGQAELSRIMGDLNCSLTYSDVKATNIDGNVSITGAKAARLSSVSGRVELAASNGNVELRDVAGPVKVDAPFSPVSAQGLYDGAELKTEHASVRVIRAADVKIKAPNSKVKAEQIAGDLAISSSNSDIEVQSVEGKLIVESEQGSVTTYDTRGPVDVKTSHGAVAIKNFYDKVRVRTSYRDVILVAAGEPAGDIEVENSHGEIKLMLPQSSQFQLEATSHSGQIRPIGFSELSQKHDERLFAMLGSVGPTIKLKTSYKNITIQASAARQV